MCSGHSAKISSPIIRNQKDIMPGLAVRQLMWACTWPAGKRWADITFGREDGKNWDTFLRLKLGGFNKQQMRQSSEVVWQRFKKSKHCGLVWCGSAGVNRWPAQLRLEKTRQDMTGEKQVKNKALIVSNMDPWYELLGHGQFFHEIWVTWHFYFASSYYLKVLRFWSCNFNINLRV